MREGRTLSIAWKPRLRFRLRTCLIVVALLALGLRPDD